MLQLVEWIALVTTLPSRNTAARMRLWRAVKALGCATLRDGVYLLPALEHTGATLRALAADVREAGGGAEVLHVAADAAQDETFRRLFDRGEDYATLLAALRKVRKKDAETGLRKLTREFMAIAATDYFPGEAKTQAAAALAELAARAAGEPRPAQADIRRLASADFAGRTWATRKHLWVDRMASSWLIRRFIDRKAKFLWLDDIKRCPQDALGFDFDGAAFTHAAPAGNAPERVTFEVLAASFGLDADPAIARIGSIVHCLDLVNVGGVPVAEAAGIEALLAGLRAAAPNDDKLLTEAARVFDGLYKSFSKEHSDD